MMLLVTNTCDTSFADLPNICGGITGNSDPMRLSKIARSTEGDHEDDQLPQQRQPAAAQPHASCHARPKGTSCQTFDHIMQVWQQWNHINLHHRDMTGQVECY